MQLYMRLIEHLLVCPQGQEGDWKAIGILVYDPLANHSSAP